MKVIIFKAVKFYEKSEKYSHTAGYTSMSSERNHSSPLLNDTSFTFVT